PGRIASFSSFMGASLASRHGTGKVCSGPPCVMYPLVKQTNGIDVGDGITCRKLAGRDRIERCAPVLQAEAGQLIGAAREAFNDLDRLRVDRCGVLHESVLERSRALGRALHGLSVELHRAPLVGAVERSVDLRALRGRFGQPNRMIEGMQGANEP